MIGCLEPTARQQARWYCRWSRSIKPEIYSMLYSSTPPTFPVTVVRSAASYTGSWGLARCLMQCSVLCRSSRLQLDRMKPHALTCHSWFECRHCYNPTTTRHPQSTSPTPQNRKVVWNQHLLSYCCYIPASVSSQCQPKILPILPVVPVTHGLTTDTTNATTREDSMWIFSCDQFNSTKAISGGITSIFELISEGLAPGSICIVLWT